jgi:hypothetical protein
MKSTISRASVARGICLLIGGAGVIAWSAGVCMAVGIHGGGGGFSAHGGGMSRGGAGFSGHGGYSPTVGGFSHGSSASGISRSDLPIGGHGEFEHGAVPGFPSAPGRISRPETPNASQLGNFLGLPGGGSAPSRTGKLDLPSDLSGRTSGLDWSKGFAGNRPAWAGLPNTSGDVASRIKNAIQPGGPHSSQIHDWMQNNPQRVEQWQNQGDKIRQQWNANGHPLDPGVRPGSDWWSKYHPLIDNDLINHGVRPGSDWWSKYHPYIDNWYYHHDWHNHGWRYWWGDPTWSAFSAWFPSWGWAEPIYYDYGAGGNVVYQNQNVYVNGQSAGTPAEFAESAADLATVDSKQAEATPKNEDWMPLGTFAVATSDKDSEPTRLLQLAVDHNGIVSGTMHNASTDKTYVVQGRVDRQTQRVAFTIGDKSDVVMETGIYNLVQEQTPVLVHYGTDRTEHYLLVRLDPPPEGGDAQKADKPGNSLLP